jgi:ketosteroid isomerase-like protein
VTTPLEDRIRRLEDAEAVCLLMARYHQACDGWDGTGTHKDPEAIAALFTEDGVWDVTARQPPPTGHEQIAALAEELRSIPWIVHFVVNPIVKVDGDAATGEFKGLLRVRLDESAPRVWAMGIYRVMARRTADGWLFRSLAWEPMTGGRYDPSGASGRT